MPPAAHPSPAAPWLRPQVADVGVGLLGKEGRQAANAADCVLPEFQHLLPLLLVHGALCRHRLSRLVTYSFYKNVVRGRSFP